MQEGRTDSPPPRRRPSSVKLVTDPATKLPALSEGPNAPVLTSKQIEELLPDFP